MSPGFDLTSLICGSEGMLAVVTEIELEAAAGSARRRHGGVQLRRQRGGDRRGAGGARQRAHAAHAGVHGRGDDRLRSSSSATKRARCWAPRRRTPARCWRWRPTPLPPRTPWRSLQALEAILTAHGGVRIGLTTDRSEALKIWRVRSELSPSCNQLGEYKISEDVAVPRHRVVEFVQALQGIGERHGLHFAELRPRRRRQLPLHADVRQRRRPAHPRGA